MKKGRKNCTRKKTPSSHQHTHTLLSSFRVQEAGTKLIVAHIPLIGTMLAIITIAPQLVALMTD